MVDTFRALANFEENENPNKEAENPNDISSVDISSIINRINDMQKAIDDIRREMTPHTENKVENVDETETHVAEVETSESEEN